MTKTEMHTNKTILRVLLAAAAVLILCGAAVGAAGADKSTAGADCSSANDLGNLLGGEVSGTTVTMTQNVTITSSHINLKDCGEITLDLNGYVLSRASSATTGQSVIEIYGPTNLILIDSNQVKEHRFTVDNNGLWTLNESAASDYEVVNGGVITGGTGGEGGGILIVNPNSKLTLESGNIVGNKTNTRGGGVAVFYGWNNTHGGTFEMKGGTIQGNTAKTDGGGVSVYPYSSATTVSFTMNGGLIANNTAAGNGGGIYIGKNGTFSMTGGTIEENTASGNGGGIFIDSKSGDTVTISGGTISENKAVTGGGIMTYRSLTLAPATGKEIIITKNEATGTGDNGAGGGIFAYGASAITVTMSGGIISGNTANGNGGGGICVEGKTTFSMSGGTIGGSADSDGNITTSSAQLRGNGGGVLVKNGAVFEMTGADALISHNKVTGSSSYGSSAVGGGVCIMGGTFTMSDGTISYNTVVNGEGGGVWMSNNITSSSGKDTKFTLSGGSISHNSASSNGGGVIVQNATALAGSVQFEMTGGDISSNTAGKSGGGVGVKYGVSRTTAFTMSGGTISNNEASGNGGGTGVGGGVFLWSDSKGLPASFKMTAGQISGNKADGAGGGGVWVEKSNFTLTGGTVGGTTEEDGNKAVAGDGGGVCIKSVGDEGMFSLENCTALISYNTALHYGGGIYLENCPVFIDNCQVTISHNTAASGGGIFSYATLQLDGPITISYNEATGTTAEDKGAGGGIFEYNQVLSIDADSDGKAPEISYNKACGNGGGGIGIEGSTGYCFMSAGTIQHNEAVNEGGGIRVTNAASFELSGGVISSNTVTDSLGGGGGACILNGSSYSMFGGEIVKNKADTGAGVCIFGSSAFTVSDAPVIRDNWTLDGTAANNVYLEDENILTLTSPLLFNSEIRITTVGAVSFEAGAQFGSTSSLPAGSGEERFFADGVNLYGSIDENGCLVWAGKGTPLPTQPYTITFDGNGGTVKPESSLSVHYGESVDLSTDVSASYSGHVLSGWAVTKNGPVVYAASQKVQDLGKITLHAVWTPDEQTHELKVTVKDENGGTVSGAVVELRQGNAVLYTKTTGESGAAAVFAGVPEGTYNVVVTHAGKTVTSFVTVDDSGTSELTVILPAKNVSSGVIVSEKDGTPAAIVKGADKVAEEIEPGENESIEVVIVVEAKTRDNAPSDAIAAIEQKAGGRTLNHLDLSVIKITTTGGWGKECVPMLSTPEVLTFIIPYDFTNKTDIMVYCFHDGNAKPLPENDTKDAGTCQIDRENGTIAIYANEFSIYSIGYVDTSKQKSSSTSQGSSVWLSEIPTAAADPTPAPTVTPTQGAPAVQPVPSQTPASPAPFAGVLAGLGAAAALFSLRRK